MVNCRPGNGTLIPAMHFSPSGQIVTQSRWPEISTASFGTTETMNLNVVFSQKTIPSVLVVLVEVITANVRTDPITNARSTRLDVGRLIFISVAMQSNAQPRRVR